MTMETMDRLAPKNMAEWNAGYETGWFDTADHPGSNPEGSEDFLFGWYCACYEFRFWQMGWDDFQSGLHMPRFDPECPDTEDLWKEGYAAAFLASEGVYL
jgi:hypothetical protein